MMSFTDQLPMTPGSSRSSSDKPAYDSWNARHALSRRFKSCSLRFTDDPFHSSIAHTAREDIQSRVDIRPPWLFVHRQRTLDPRRSRRAKWHAGQPGNRVGHRAGFACGRPVYLVLHSDKVARRSRVACTPCCSDHESSSVPQWKRSCRWLARNVTVPLCKDSLYDSFDHSVSCDCISNRFAKMIYATPTRHLG